MPNLNPAEAKTAFWGKPWWTSKRHLMVRRPTGWYRACRARTEDADVDLKREIEGGWDCEHCKTCDQIDIAALRGRRGGDR